MHISMAVVLVEKNQTWRTAGRGVFVGGRSVNDARRGARQVVHAFGEELGEPN